MSNRLAKETSPYLLHHANNPVNWYPWGDDALERAEREDKPILLSIGYSTCHWCQVMERESFSNAAIATLLNEHFVCIKVDREERPDLDEVYMSATIAISGAGGWPMTVFLTPERTPFFAGTYFPPFDNEGKPGFATLIKRVASMWDADRDALFREASEIATHVNKQSELPTAANLPAAAVELAVTQLEKAFDQENGGFSSAPKFPPCESLQLLLSHHERTKKEASLRMVTTTLDAMKNGGLYDQLAGGFARYSTDNTWHVPHFEKMLYDNAQLARIYIAALQVTGNAEYSRVGRETLDFLLQRMRAEAGGFCSALNADSEEQEGKHYTFRKQDLAEVLNDTELRLFCEYYDVTLQGNWEGTNVLWRPNSPERVAEKLEVVHLDAFQEALEQMRSKVLAYRDKRPLPVRDHKVITSWNGLAISALASGYRALGEKRFLDHAIVTAEFLWKRHRTEAGRLLRTLRGKQPPIGAFLDDHAFFADSLICLYECSGQLRFLNWAKQLAEELKERFLDPTSGAFFQTANDAEVILSRIRDGNDGALPNANATAAKVFARLGLHCLEPELTSVARAALRTYAQRIDQLPRAFTSALNALEWLITPPAEVVVTDDSENTRRPSHETDLFRALGRTYLPISVIGHAGPSHVEDTRPWVTEKSSPGQATMYLCTSGSCDTPIHSPNLVSALLETTKSQLRSQRLQTLAGLPLSGRATKEGTRRYFANRGLTNAWKPFGQTGLQVSKLGFGAYRLADGAQDHDGALRVALEGGVNIVDTAPSYADGGSELVVGRVLSDLIRRDKLCRDEVLLCSKFGILPSAEVHLGRFGKLSSLRGASSSSTFEVASDTFYSLDPAQLDIQLETSLRRLGVDTLDVCLLHNPEILLTHFLRNKTAEASAVSRFKEQLQTAYRWCERQVASGRIGFYGVSSSALGQASPTVEEGVEEDEVRAELRQVLSLELLLGHLGPSGASVLQLPFNPLEYASRRSLLDEAQERGLAVMGHRPLNAIQHGELLRLAEPRVNPHAPDFTAAMTALRRLEQEFGAKLGAILKSVPENQLGMDSLFSWCDRITEFEVGRFEVWTEFERSALGRELPRVLQAMDRAFAGKELGRHWTSWKERYVTAFETLIVAARAKSALGSREQTKEFAASLRQHCPVSRRQAELSQLVLWSLSSIESVQTTLTGMRSPQYAQQAVSILNWPDNVDAQEALEGCALVTRQDT